MNVFATGDEPDATPVERFERLLDLPPSAKLVYKVLAEADQLTQDQIRTRALLPARTTRDALGKLEEAGLVDVRLYVPDARKRLYVSRAIANPEESEEGR